MTLVDLINNNNIKIMVEIGVYKSKGIKRILRSEVKSLEQYYAIDPFMLLGALYGHMGDITQEEWDELYSQSCSLMHWFPQLHIIRMQSHIAAKVFENKSLDLVYIDADHCYKAVTNDIDIWLPKIKKGGIISGHDYGDKKHPDVERAVIKKLGKVKLGKSKLWYKEVN